MVYINLIQVLPYSSPVYFQLDTAITVPGAAHYLRFVIFTIARVITIRYKTGINHIKLHSNTGMDLRQLVYLFFLVSGRLTYKSQHALKFLRHPRGTVIESTLFVF